MNLQCWKYQSFQIDWQIFSQASCPADNPMKSTTRGKDLGSHLHDGNALPSQLWMLVGRLSQKRSTSKVRFRQWLLQMTSNGKWCFDEGCAEICCLKWTPCNTLVGMNLGMLYLVIGYCTCNEVVSIERTTSERGNHLPKLRTLCMLKPLTASTPIPIRGFYKVHWN